MSRGPAGLPQSVEGEIRRLDSELRRLLASGVDMSGPGWFARFKARQAEIRESHPEADRIRDEAERILPQLLDLYVDCGDADRAALRDLLAQCHWVRWSLGRDLARSDGPMTEDDLRQQLVLFSMKDQERDWRDAMLWLEAICRRAGAAQLNLAERLRDMARLSSDDPRFKGHRSTRAMMLHYAARAEGAAAPDR
jgi:hypothetical protein